MLQYQLARYEYVKTIEFFSPGIKDSEEPLHVQKIQNYIIIIMMKMELGKQ